MGSIRAFAKKDASQLPCLHSRAFGGGNGVSDAYFEAVFLDNPWFDGSIPSLVYEEDDGRIVGFLGVVPRPFFLKQQRIQVAIASHLMVDPSHTSRALGLRLFKRFLSGPQDLSCADYVNLKGRKVWGVFQSDAVWAYRLRWSCMLRPYCSRRAQSLLRRWRQRPFMARAVSSLCSAVNVCEDRIRGLHRRSEAPHVTEAEIDEDTMIAAWPEFSAQRSLRPAYDAQSLKWILRRAAADTQHGILHKMGVRDRGGHLIGYYVYYLKSGGEGRVLQLAANRNSIADVLDSLFFHAWRGQANTVSGRLDPGFMNALAAKFNMRYFLTDYWMMVHARDPEVLSLIHRGDAFFTDLDGEWLMRFHGEVS